MTLMQITVPCARLGNAPTAAAAAVTSVVFGERVVVQERRDGFLRVTAKRDGYSGWLAADAAVESGAESTHIVFVRAAPVFPGSDVKAPPLRLLPATATVSVRHRPENHADNRPGSRSENWCVLTDGTVMWADHLKPVGWQEQDPVAVAEALYQGTPYVWGGKTPCGSDCSGLVQSCFFLCGRSLPRDSGPQLDALEPVSGPPQRGMIAGFKGHIGLMVSDTRLLHANATAMAVSIDPLDAIIRQVEAADGAGAYKGLFRYPA